MPLRLKGLGDSSSDHLVDVIWAWNCPLRTVGRTCPLWQTAMVGRMPCWSCRLMTAGRTHLRSVLEGPRALLQDLATPPPW